MSPRKMIGWTGTLAVLLAGFFGASFSMKAADNPDSEQVSKLLSESKTMAFQLKEDAVSMESFNRSAVSWQSHAAAINQIKEHVNAFARQVDKLKAARSGASPWQRTVIDRIDPFMSEMQGYTSAVIEQLTRHPEGIGTPGYKDYLEANADYASDMAAMIANFVDYGRTKQRLQDLTDRLEISAR